MSVEDPNPYAPPRADTQQHSVRFALSDEQAKLITTTATLMIVGGAVQLLVVLAALIEGELALARVAVAAIIAVIPAFIAIAGFSLRSAAQDGSLDGLLAGIRQLRVAFLVKGVALSILVALMLLMFALMVLGVGLGFAGLFR